MKVPQQWQVERREVDRWFGVERLPVTCHWNEEGPRYEIGGEVFNHETLLGGLLEGHRGARLPDGRLLSFDGSLVQKNEAIFAGVRQLHRDPIRQQYLLRRIGPGEVEKRPDIEEKTGPCQILAGPICGPTNRKVFNGSWPALLRKSPPCLRMTWVWVKPFKPWLFSMALKKISPS